MLNSHEITEELPAQRDDEPPSLRRDIVDEILDHLHVAMRRELLVRGGSEDSAWKRVIEHFGDPRQVARRLWFQAMWSRIMTQRLVVISALVSMTLSVVLTAMVGWMIHGQQQTNAALVDQVSKLVLQKSSPVPERDPRWNNLKIKATQGTRNGPAAEGLEVTVSKVPDIGEVVPEENGSNSTKTAVRKKHEAKTDAQGLVDCGFVVPGLYKLKVESPTLESYSSTFTIYPGRDHVEEVVAPATEPELADVSFDLAGLPEDLDSKKYGLILSFHQIDDRKMDGQSWRASSWFPFESTPFVMIIPGRGVWLACIPPGGDGTERWPPAIFYPQKGKAAQWQRLEQPYRFRIPAHQYSVCFDFVRMPLEMTPDDPEWNRNILHEPLDTTVAWTNAGPGFHQDPNVIKLLAHSGQMNEWTVDIPNGLLKAWPEKGSQPATIAMRNRGGRPRVGSRSGGNIVPRLPRLVDEALGDSPFVPRLQLTSHQQSELIVVWGQQMKMANDVGFNASSPESKEKMREGLAKLDLKAIEILTAEQKQIWEERRAELIQERIEEDMHTLRNQDDGAITKLRQKYYLEATKLTEEQMQKLNDVKGQLEAERRKFVEANLSSPQDEQQKSWLTKFREYDKQFAECLTEEQMSTLSRRIGLPAMAPQ